MSEAAQESSAAPVEGRGDGTQSGVEAGSTVDQHGRYRIVEREGRRFIRSGNAPNIELHVERGLAVDASGRKKFGAQAVFLDGVYTGAPFCDNEARQYSLDHHAGCVRTFTLATCEQAVVMLLQGLPLSTGSWTLWVNDPDLDSMLAAWVLMNHVELLRDDRALLKHAMPAIRLEGVIDGHGTDREILTGMPQDALEAAREQVDRLVEPELDIKGSGGWGKLDFIHYACEHLERLDGELLPHGEVDALMEIEELGRATLVNDRIAVLLSSTLGIYAVEERLKERYGASLGVIVLKTGAERYTLRLVDQFLPKNLEAVYAALNRTDPRAQKKGKNPNVWGGSTDIGGSPRGTGTGLEGQAILDVVASVLGPHVPWWRRLWRSFLALLRPSKPRLPPPSSG